MKGNWSIVRQVFHRRFSNLRSSTPTSRSLSTSVRPLAPSSMTSLIPRKSVFPASNSGSSLEFKFSSTSFPQRRSFCSAEGGEKGVVLVNSEEDFISAVRKAQGIISVSGLISLCSYFISVRFISSEIVEITPGRFTPPVIEELSKQYPDVTIYEFNIDMGEPYNTIGDFTSVPTLYFFKGGSKQGEIVGADVTKQGEVVVADVTKLNNLMEQLYK